MRAVYIALYYCFARHLPISSSRWTLWCRKVRRFLVSHIFDYCGPAVNVEKGAFFGDGRGISIGEYSGLGVNCNVHGPLSIGQHVMMGPDVTILTHSHSYDRMDIPMDKQERIIKPVSIGNDVWIGMRAIIMPGVSIGNGVIIGAGAVVTKDIPDYAVVGGVPARIIKYRSKS